MRRAHNQRASTCLFKMAQNKFDSDAEILITWLARGTQRAAFTSLQLKDIYQLSKLFIQEATDLPQITRLSVDWSATTQEHIKRLTAISPAEKSKLFQYLVQLCFVPNSCEPNENATVVAFPRIHLPGRPKRLSTFSFGGDFLMPMKGFALPSTTKTLVLQECFNAPLEALNVPKGIEYLSLGTVFDRTLPIDMDVRFPSLRILYLSHAFNKPLDDSIRWPKTLEVLIIGAMYTHPNPVLPPCLKSVMIFTSTDLYESTVGVGTCSMPTSLRFIRCSHPQSFIHDASVNLPKLKVLELPKAKIDVRATLLKFPTLARLEYDPNGSYYSVGHHPNARSLISYTVVPGAFPVQVTSSYTSSYVPPVATDYGKWANAFGAFSNLKALVLPDNFDEDLTNVPLPPTLQKLSLGNEWNGDLAFVSLLQDLRNIKLSEAFNQPLEHVQFPDKIRRIKFGDSFNQSIRQVRLPKQLRVLIFGGQYARSMRQVRLPKKLQVLRMGYAWNKSLEHLKCPDSLEELAFGDDFQGEGLQQFVWPRFLKSLSVGRKFNADLSLLGDKLAPSVETLWLGMTAYKHSFVGVCWPYSCSRIYCHASLKDNFLKSKKHDLKVLKLTAPNHWSSDCQVTFHRQLVRSD